MTVADLDWLLLHQANQRILDSAAQRLKMPPERVISNLAKYGNTSAASIPLALDEAVRSGAVAPGHKVLNFSLCQFMPNLAECASRPP